MTKHVGPPTIAQPSVIAAPSSVPEGSMVYMMPLSRPLHKHTLPILMVEYEVDDATGKRNHSFGVKPTAFQRADIRCGSTVRLPAIVWTGEGVVLGLVFSLGTAREKCIKRLGRRKVFALSLERDLQASFLLRNFNPSTPGDDVELYQVCGQDYTIMSRRVGQRGFVVVDPTWSALPCFVPYGSVGQLGTFGNWVFVATCNEAKETRVCILECATPEVAQQLAQSLKQRDQRQISTSDTILQVTTWNVSEENKPITSHSEAGQSNRVPFQTAWNEFLQSIPPRKA